MPTISWNNKTAINHPKSKFSDNFDLNIRIIMNGDEQKVVDVESENDSQATNLPADKNKQQEIENFLPDNKSIELSPIDENIKNEMALDGQVSSQKCHRNVNVKFQNQSESSSLHRNDIPSKGDILRDQDSACLNLSFTQNVDDQCIRTCQDISDSNAQIVSIKADLQDPNFINKCDIEGQTCHDGSEIDFPNKASANASVSTKSDKVTEKVCDPVIEADSKKDTQRVALSLQPKHEPSKTVESSNIDYNNSYSLSSGPIPCSSKDTSISHSKQARITAGRSSTVCDDSPFKEEALRCSRKSLPLIPRINQYERHPLLQTKSGEGLSELEMFLLEKEESLERQNSTSRGRMNLIPRSAHSEPNPLLQRFESGLCELEQLLLEKDEEYSSRRLSKSESHLKDSDSAKRKAQNHSLQRRSTMSKLEPRMSQRERHSLLQDRDEFGFSELDRLLQEKNKEMSEKGKCCTGRACKNSQCTNCKTNVKQSAESRKSSSSVQSPTNPNQPQCGTSTAARGSSGQIKRVHFEGGGVSKDEENSSQNLSDKTCQATSDLQSTEKSRNQSNLAGDRPPGSVEDCASGIADKETEAKLSDNNHTAGSNKAVVKCKKTRGRKLCCFK